MYPICPLWIAGKVFIFPTFLGLISATLYTKHANGNILHTAWKELIEVKNFPFLKVSLLRDNPMHQEIDAWEQVISERNPALAAQIRSQLRPPKP